MGAAMVDGEPQQGGDPSAGVASSDDITDSFTANENDSPLAEFSVGKAFAFGLLFALLGAAFWSWLAYVSASQINLLGVVVIGWMAGVGVKRVGQGFVAQFVAVLVTVIGMLVGIVMWSMTMKVILEGYPFVFVEVLKFSKVALKLSLSNTSVLFYLASLACAFLLPADLKGSSDADSASETGTSEHS